MSRLLAVLVAILALGWPVPVPAQGGESAVRAWRRANERRILDEFLGFLAIPNVASDRANIERNAEHLSAMLRARGVEPRLLRAADPSVPPVVYGEVLVPGATRTIVFYAHYDGQPADPRSWAGGVPWKPVIRTGPLASSPSEVSLPQERIDPEWRIFARSASDDKAGVMAILAALDALRASKISPAVNVKLFFEGEEEAGSPHLSEILSRHRDLLAADAWIICDGPTHQSGRKQVVFGVRGITVADITVYGPKRPLHSGHYGNWAPNPAMLLARLLASTKDETGRVTIAGWYDDMAPIGEEERRALALLPSNDEEVRRSLAFGQAEGGGRPLAELILYPSLNVNGLASAEVGPASRNVIPTEATASLDLRLVKGNDPRRQFEKLVAHVRAQGYFVVDREPTDAERLAHPLIARVAQRDGGYEAERTPLDLPVSRSVVAAVQSTSREPVLLVPTLGGSLPLSIFRRELGATTITVPVVNHDNNQHAENENLRIQNLWDGVETMAAVMTMRWLD